MFHVKPRSCLTELEGSLLKSEEHGDQSEHTAHCYACECLSDTRTLGRELLPCGTGNDLFPRWVRSLRRGDRLKSEGVRVAVIQLCCREPCPYIPMLAWLSFQCIDTVTCIQESTLIQSIPRATLSSGQGVAPMVVFEIGGLSRDSVFSTSTYGHHCESHPRRAYDDWTSP